MGGIHATMCSDEASERVDAVITGEAESVWAEVLDDFRQGALKGLYEGTRLDIFDTTHNIFLNLQALQVRLVHPDEEQRYQALMQAHHYLGSLAKIGETLWYVATYVGEWVALLSFSSAALKCAARDRWIGWNFRHQYSRLNLLTNNSRFLILPAWHYPNLASKTLSLCLKRLSGDWQTYFNHPLLLVETFVDPARFQGTLYKARPPAHDPTSGLRRGIPTRSRYPAVCATSPHRTNEW